MLNFETILTMTPRTKRLLWVSGFFAAGLLVVSAVDFKNASKSRGLVIEIEHLEGDNDFITHREVERLLKKSFDIDFNDAELREIEVDRVERVLEAEPFIADADAYVDAENKLHVIVRQRIPILRVMDVNGGNYYLDAEGNKFPTSKHYTARCLVATGYLPPHTPDFLKKKKHGLKDLFELAQTIRADDFLIALTEQIHLNNAGDYLLVPKIGDQKIVLGNTVDLADKFSRLKTFYRQGLPYEGWNKYRTINLKYAGQVVCRR